MKQKLIHLTFTLFVASVLQIPFSPVHAEKKGKGFMVQVRTDKGEIPVRFYETEEHHAWLGYGEYNHPAIPIDMTGEIFIPDCVTTPDGHRLVVNGISRGAFQGCRNIAKIHLPNTIQYISDYSFQFCSSLREINFPGKLKVIYPLAFENCNALQRVFMRNINPPFVYAEGVFSERSRQTLTIVYYFTNKYVTDPYFSKFRYSTELIPSYSEQQP